MRKPPPLLTPRIIADLRAGEECSDPDYPGLRVRSKRVFSDAELATFVRWLPRSPHSRTVRDAMALVLLTGCRSGEVVAALWRDIDLERAVWTIRETKNGEPHDVMLSRQAKLGCPRVVQDRILNHVDGSVSAIYDRHRYDAEARIWLQKWADYLESLTVRNVVPLRAA